MSSVLFKLARPLLYRLDPEKAHEFAITALAKHWVPSSRPVHHPSLEQSCFGLDFYNPVGLAAGFDKNAQAITGLVHQGFGFIEIGTVTPKPQPGNPKPRLFRLKEDRAIINRLGFNNDGSDVIHERLAALPKQPAVIGVNIGRNKDCDHPLKDYVALVHKMADVADYITINVSSPNTQGLRDLQRKRSLEDLLKAVFDARGRSANLDVPLLLKIAPDIDDTMQVNIAELALAYGLDGIIISNTTIKRPKTLKSNKHGEIGGLSGAPLMQPSTVLLSEMYKLTGGQIPLIGVGGIQHAQDAFTKIQAGASLVQIYTAFIYEGFELVERINRELIKLLEQHGFSHIREAVGAKLAVDDT